jgi:hypothetical protein
MVVPPSLVAAIAGQKDEGEHIVKQTDSRPVPFYYCACTAAASPDLTASVFCQEVGHRWF